MRGLAASREQAAAMVDTLTDDDQRVIVLKCECGNDVNESNVWCDYCEPIDDDGMPHSGHWSLFGTYWCDTCDSPLCDLL